MDTTINYKQIIEKDIEDLSPELIQEIIDFIGFLKNKKKKDINNGTLLLQQKSLNRIWNTESEDIYEL